MPELIVTVGLAPGTSMITLSFELGTVPVLQSLASFQSPLLAETHSTVVGDTTPPEMVPLTSSVLA